MESEFLEMFDAALASGWVRTRTLNSRKVSLAVLPAFFMVLLPLLGAAPMAFLAKRPLRRRKKTKSKASRGACY